MFHLNMLYTFKPQEPNPETWAWLCMHVLVQVSGTELINPTFTHTHTHVQTHS